MAMAHPVSVSPVPIQSPKQCKEREREKSSPSLAVCEFYIYDVSSSAPNKIGLLALEKLCPLGVFLEFSLFHLEQV